MMWCVLEKLVSVVIPSYNRAHLLQYILPTYIQEYVGEIILVNDSSTDNTDEVMKKITEKYNIIKYIKLNRNRKQMFAKNVGILNAKYDYIYFGDDDSFITEGTIKQLFYTLTKYKCDIVGARALYMRNHDSLDNIAKFISKFNVHADKNSKLFDFNTLKANFTLLYNYPKRTNMVPACFLIKTKLAKKVMFDVKYTGNCYREETDFLVRAQRFGAIIYYNSKANQINLPRNQASGGAHASGRVKWIFQSINNNNYFLDKNYNVIKQKHNIIKSKFAMKFRFYCEMLLLLLKYFIKITLITLISFIPLKKSRKILEILEV